MTVNQNYIREITTIQVWYYDRNKQADQTYPIIKFLKKF